MKISSKLLFRKVTSFLPACLPPSFPSLFSSLFLPLIFFLQFLEDVPIDFSQTLTYRNKSKLGSTKILHSLSTNENSDAKIYLISNFDSSKITDCLRASCCFHLKIRKLEDEIWDWVRIRNLQNTTRRKRKLMGSL